MSEKRIYYYHKIDSTNRCLKDLARQNAPEGTFVIAASQTTGRGRMGRSFYSPKDTGLYLSVLYRPKICDNMLSVTMRSAVAAVQAIESVCHVSPDIKWVNDLYLNGKKIAGILAEGLTENNTINAVILGIGINLWEPEAGFPPELSNIAGSIYGKSAPDPKIRTDLTEALIAHLYPLNDSPEMIEIYRNHSMITGKQVVLFHGQTIIRGSVKGFTDSGELILMSDDGNEKIFSSGEISLRLTHTDKF